LDQPPQASQRDGSRADTQANLTRGPALNLTTKARRFPSEGHSGGGVYPRPSPGPAGLRDTAMGLVRLLSRLTTLK
jgi:hypothetical protein